MSLPGFGPDTVSVSLSALAVLGAVLTLPAFVFAHELGHAVPALLSGGRAHVMVGAEEGRSVGSGRLRVTLGRDGPLTPAYFGYCRWDEVHSRRARVAAHLGGPAVSAVAVLGLLVAAGSAKPGPLRVGLWFLLGNQTVVVATTMVPVTYPDWFGRYAHETSDGRKLLETLRG